MKVIKFIGKMGNTAKEYRLCPYDYNTIHMAEKHELFTKGGWKVELIYEITNGQTNYPLVGIVYIPMGKDNFKTEVISYNYSGKTNVNTLNNEFDLYYQMEREKKTFPFTIEAAKNGEDVETKSGKKVRIICYDSHVRANYPIIGLVRDSDYLTFENICEFDKDGVNGTFFLPQEETFVESFTCISSTKSGDNRKRDTDYDLVIRKYDDNDGFLQ